MSKNKKTYSIEVELTDHQVYMLRRKLPEAASDGQALAMAAASSLADLADGGLVLSGNIMQQIRDVAGIIGDPQLLVNLVAAGKGQVNGNTQVVWEIDPTELPYYQSIADSNQMTLAQYLKNLMEWVRVQGWLGGVVPDAEVVYVSYSDMARLREVMGTPQVGGRDMARAILDSVQAVHKVEQLAR